MKSSKKAVSLLLAATMILSCIAIAIPFFSLNASAATTIDGVTQTQIVTDTTVYNTYAANYLNGAAYSTGIIIPGLDPAQDYVIQGMTYYPARDWMLVTAYHNDGTESSKVFALDAGTGKFVAMFSFLNPDGSVNMDHGGGIAVSENNIYYSCGDKDRKIAYAPLSALANAPLNVHTQIQLVAEKDFVEIGSVSYDSKTAYSAYVCYDEGILWVGNFYDLGAKLLGVTIAAADYNAPSNNTYNSMVFGYKLSGNSSTEEWANLTSGTSDCQGSPSYAIGLNNTLKDVQYATVDNGKLYLSRSYGSGSGNSINFGFGETSFLTVADIDLSVPGTKDITISTTSTGSLNKTIKAYDISDYRNFPMMPMSEGLCVVDDNIFITFEGASNKYLNESSGVTSIGNCEKPVDVIWQLDPYDLMEVEVPAPEKSIRYEKVESFDDIKNGDEYIIVHESREKNPVTQLPYLYAIDAFGNFKDYKLSKSTASTVVGYDGMVGYPIEYYSIVEDEESGKEFLYLDNPEIDDIENIRWTLEKVTDKANSNAKVYRIKNTGTYFANCNNFFFDDNQITMAPSNANFLNDIEIYYSNDGDGGFWISNNEAYFLWCNEGNYNDKINSFYSKNSSTPMYSGLQEQNGTFHCDALNLSGINILGGPIETGEESFYRDGLFNIYRRVVDETTSTYESRVYTNLKASLQADGTYTVDLETYAISPNHYQYVGNKPTDYIIIADTSSSMSEKGSTGLKEFNGSLGVASLSQEANTSDDNGIGISGYGFTNPGEDIYLKHSDGNYYQVYMAVNTTELKKVVGIISKFRQKYYAYYIANDGLYYCIEDHAVNTTGRTFEQFKAWVESGENESDYSTKTSNGNRRGEDVYQGVHYRFDDVSSLFTTDHTRIETLKNAASNLAGQIASENSQNRIALVQFGGSSGFYNTSSTLSTSDYANAFWSASNVSGLKTIINNLSTSKLTSNDGTEFAYVNGIMSNSGATYTGTEKTRNIVIIYLSDGVVGHDDQNDFTTAANNNIAKALTAKKSGAFIYTVTIGADGTSNDRNRYMDAISSKYAEAASMTQLGGQSVDGINYTLSLATITIHNFINFGNFALNETSQNAGVSLDNLDANSYLREQLSDAFLFPDGWTVDDNVEISFVPGEYDAIGRFSFGTAKDATNDVTASVDTSTKTITVTGYDYSKQYISKGVDGNALKVTISGLIANKDAKIQNTSINNTKTTGLYKSKGNMDNNIEFRMLPTEYFNIPVYNYTLDFGFDMLDAEINGTLKSVSSDLSKQTTYSDVDSQGNVTITDNNQNLIYNLNPSVLENKAYVLIQRTEGEDPTYEYDWFCIKLSPASNVYYEQGEFETGTAGKVSWASEGTKSFSYQTPGNPETDIHGYDLNYADGKNGHSNGVASKVTLTPSTKKSDAQKFTFYGTGFDLVSACGPDTGIMTVKVTDQSGKLVKGYMIDTYYGDETYMNDNDLLCQVPIVNYVNKNSEGDVVAATLNVEVTAVYLSTAGALAPTPASISETEIADGVEATTAVAVDNSAIYDELKVLGMDDLANTELELVWFDDNSILNGGAGAYGTEDGIEMADDEVKSLRCYLDGFRIYHPLGSSNADYIASEQNATYVNVINNIGGSIGSDSSLSNIAYIGRNLNDGETLTFADYQNEGPQNELYLMPGSDALAFKVNLPDPSSKVHLGLRAVNGTAKVKIGGTEFEISSATEMYYDISECLTVSEGVATITIQNTGSVDSKNMLAVNNIKLTNGASAVAVSEDDLELYTMSINAPAEEAFVVNGKVTTEKVEEELPPETEEIPAELSIWEKAINFIRDIFTTIFTFLSDVFVFLIKGGIF